MPTYCRLVQLAASEQEFHTGRQQACCPRAASHLHEGVPEGRLWASWGARVPTSDCLAHGLVGPGALRIGVLGSSPWLLYSCGKPAGRPFSNIAADRAHTAAKPKAERLGYLWALYVGGSPGVS